MIERCLLTIAISIGALLAAAPSIASGGASGSPSGGTLCGPFAASASAVSAGPVEEAGVSASAASDEYGSIVPLPARTPQATTSSSNDPSEAILALPKNEAGQIPDDFELGPGASITDSFFSPVICATVARVAGPPGASITELVTVVPEGSAIVPNDVYASAAAEVSPAPSETTPDPYASLQYGLAISGVREARGLSTGEGVTIALLDSAPEVGHRDLSAANVIPVGQEGESPEVGVHGTLMAGVINAIEDNGFGIAGLAPGATLVSIPICRPTGAAGGQCTIYDLLRGLDQAWDAEASIVNLSLSGPPNILLERGVARLEELGAVVVAAAGNEGTDERRYPAAYPSVIGVGAVDKAGTLFSGSNRGPWVELVAPGVDVLSTVPGDSFAFGNGTSLAAAHVSGLLAVLTTITEDPRLARGELFRAVGARGNQRIRTVPPICDVFARMQRPCDGPNATTSAPAAR